MRLPSLVPYPAWQNSRCGLLSAAWPEFAGGVTGGMAAPHLWSSLRQRAGHYGRSGGVCGVLTAPQRRRRAGRGAAGCGARIWASLAVVRCSAVTVDVQWNGIPGARNGPSQAGDLLRRWRTPALSAVVDGMRWRRAKDPIRRSGATHVRAVGRDVGLRRGLGSAVEHRTVYAVAGADWHLSDGDVRHGVNAANVRCGNRAVAAAWTFTSSRIADFEWRGPGGGLAARRVYTRGRGPMPMDCASPAAEDRRSNVDCQPWAVSGG